MKTLKKTLCLVLAVVMAVGVLILPANAAKYEDFDDNDKIAPDYEVAVATLTGMGIINGKSENAFEPTAPVTRAEAATLIATTLATPAGRALAVLGSTHPFTDVGAAHSWASSNIGYVYELGIVSGKDATHFYPDATVTGYELLTMLMKATGYEPKNANATWTSKAVEFAIEYEIFADGLTDVIADPNKALTREETAQMIWQAINHSPDGTVSVGYQVYVDNDGDAAYDPAVDQSIDVVDSLVEALLVMQTWSNSHEDDVVSYRKTTVNTGSIGDTLYHLQFNEDTDTYGRSTYGYIDSSKDRDNVYSKLVTPADKVYTDGVKLSAALKGIGFKDGAEVTVTVTNKYLADSTYASGAKYKVGEKTGDIEYKPGTRVEVYKTGSASAKLVVIETFIYQLTADDIHKATDDDPAYVSITMANDVTYTKVTSEFAKDQIVIFTLNTELESIVDMSVADTFTGRVTASASGYIRVENEKKLLSAHAVDADWEEAVIGTSDGYKYSGNTEYTFYVDSYSHILLATTEAEAPVPTNYVYVVKSRVQPYNSGEGDELLGTVGEGHRDAIAKARVIDPETGEIKVVDIAMGRHTDGKYYFKNERGSLMTNKEVTVANAPAVGFHKFAELTDGTYAILDAESTIPVSLDSGKANIAVGKFANSSTKLCVTSYKNDTASSTSFSAYNGYSSFPDKDYSAIVVADSKGIVSKILVVKQGEEEAPVVALNYAVYKGQGETTDKAHLEFYVDGEVVTYVDETNQKLTAGKVYNLKVTDDVVVAEEIENYPTQGAVSILQPDYFVAGNTLYYLSVDTTIVDATDDYAVVDDLSSAKEVLVFYATTSYGDNVAQFIVIVK